MDRKIVMRCTCEVVVEGVECHFLKFGTLKCHKVYFPPNKIVSSFCFNIPFPCYAMNPPEVNKTNAFWEKNKR
jgi:hypothetical protein